MQPKKMVKLFLRSGLSFIIFVFVLLLTANFSLDTVVQGVFEQVYQRARPDVRHETDNKLETMCASLLNIRELGENVTEIVNIEQLKQYCNDNERLDALRQNCAYLESNEISVEELIKRCEAFDARAFLENCDVISLMLESPDISAELSELSRICEGFERSAYQETCEQLEELEELSPDEIPAELEATQTLCHQYSPGALEEQCDIVSQLESAGGGDAAAALYDMQETCSRTDADELERSCTALASLETSQGRADVSEVSNMCQRIKTGSFEQTCESLAENQELGGERAEGLIPDFEIIADECAKGEHGRDLFAGIMSSSIDSSKVIQSREGTFADDSIQLLKRKRLAVFLLFSIMLALGYMVYLLEEKHLLHTLHDISGVVMRNGIMIMILFVAVHGFLFVMDTDTSFMLSQIEYDSPDERVGRSFKATLPLVLGEIVTFQIMLAGAGIFLLGLAGTLYFPKAKEEII